MQSKFWVGVLSFAGLALFALAHDEGSEATANKAAPTQDAPSSGSTAATSEDDTGTVETALEVIADTANDSVDGAPPEAADATTEAVASSAAADENYTPSERISEDRSVSFPVDI
jgi:hypothetical protein